MKSEITLRFRNEDEGKNLTVTLDDIGTITFSIKYDGESSTKNFKVPDYTMGKIVHNLKKLQEAQEGSNLL